jgi:hypothetical protein
MKKTLIRSLYFYTLAALYPFLAQAKDNPELNTARFQKTPLVFIENKGQIVDENGKNRNDIHFRIAAQEVNIFVESGEIHYQWTKLKNFDPKAEKANLDVDIYRLDVELEGANKGVLPIRNESNDYFENYYLPHCREGVTAHAFNKVTYPNIYPNIDWVLYNNDGHLKYDFIVRPGGNPADIKLKYSGNTGRTTDAEGNIHIITPFGSITEQKLVCLNNGQVVPSSFNSTDEHHVGFNIGDYKGTLIIDPQVEWSTYYGGSVLETGYTVATDTSGGAYLGGWTTSTGNIATSGTHQTSHAGSKDAYLVRFSKTCSRVWGTYYGGSGDDDFFSSALDTGGNIYLAGITNSTGLSSGAVHQTALGGGTDCYVVKFNSITGTRIWATYYGGTSNESIANEHQVWIACDTKNNLYLCGNTTSTGANVISTAGSYQPNLSQALAGTFSDGFLARLTDGGTRVWGTYFGDTASDRMIKIIFDRANNVYVAGEVKTPSNNSIATSNGHQQSYGGGPSDVFLTKFTPAGQRVWSTFYGGSGLESPEGLAADVYNYIYMSGSTNSQTAISTPNSHQPALAGSGVTQDCFLVKFDTAGNRIWGTYYGGDNVDHCGDMAMDAFGNICFTGFTGSNIGISTPGVPQATLGGGFDAFLAIFTLNGVRYWASYIGGTDFDNGWGLKYSKFGDLYLVGNSASATNIATTTSGTYQIARSGVQDAFLTKYQADTSTFILYPFNVTNICAGDSFDINYGITNPFRAGNIFYLQLSDATGSFANPDTIGSLASVGTGTIRGRTKITTAGGTGYRVRIVSSKPASTSLETIVPMTIRTLPVKPIAGSNTPVCSDGAPLNLTAVTTTPGVSYSWTGPNSFTSILQNPTVTSPPIAATGDYVLTVTLNGCYTKDTENVVVNITPVKPTVSSSSPVCEGGNLNLFASTITTGVTYSWTGPDTFASTLQNPTRYGIKSLSAGYYVATAARLACISKDSVLVTTNPTFTPVVTASVSPADTICLGDTLTFTGIGAGGGPAPTYQWQKNGVDISGEITANLTYSGLADQDVLTLIYKGSGPCLSVPADTSDGIVITVLSAVVPGVAINASPGITIPPNTLITFSTKDTNGGSAPSYKWYRNNIEIPGAISNVLPQYSTVDLQTGDQICVTMISSLSCAEPDSASACTQLIEVTGIDGLTGANGLQLFPNPNNGSFTLKASAAGNKPLVLEVINAIGQSVFTTTVMPVNNELNTTVNLGEQHANGLYMLRIKGDNGLKQIKFTLRQ